MSLQFTLRLTWINKKELACELLVPESMQITSPESVEMTGRARENILGHYDSILELLRNDGKPDTDMFGQELESLGRTIGEILHKAWYRLGLNATPMEEIELALALDETTVDIPWELSILQKGSPVHMCEKISLGRLRVVKDRRWTGKFENGGKSRNDDSISALVIGINYEHMRSKGLGRLYQAEEEAEVISSYLEGHGLDVTPLIGKKKATRSRIVHELKREVDILHFSGHGTMEEGRGKIATSDGKPISTTDFKEIFGEDKYAPRFSFINACETSLERNAAHRDEWMYSWADTLARYGGRAFIGTLLGYRKLSLGEALRQARHELKKEKDWKHDVTWPAYVLYGVPWLKADDFFPSR